MVLGFFDDYFVFDLWNYFVFDLWERVIFRLVMVGKSNEIFWVRSLTFDVENGLMEIFGVNKVHFIFLMGKVEVGHFLDLSFDEIENFINLLMLFINVVSVLLLNYRIRQQTQLIRVLHLKPLFYY